MSKPPPDTRWVTTETIGSAEREDRIFAAVMAVVFVAFITFIIWVVVTAAGESRRDAPHEDRCLLTNGRIVHLNQGAACLVDGAVTDRW